jgi:hypothetical protein
MWERLRDAVTPAQEKPVVEPDEPQPE